MEMYFTFTAFLRPSHLLHLQATPPKIFWAVHSVCGFVWLAGAHELQFYECERVKEARMHGIQTLVCVATSCGVLELASFDVIKEDRGLVYLSKSLYGSDNKRVLQQDRREADVVLVPLLENGMFSGAQKELLKYG